MSPGVLSRSSIGNGKNLSRRQQASFGRLRAPWEMLAKVSDRQVTTRLRASQSDRNTRLWGA